MPMHLTEDMIRVTDSGFGTRGPIRERRLVVFVGHFGLKDKRGNLRRFARRRAAYKAAREYIAEHNESCSDETHVGHGVTLQPLEVTS